MNQLLRQGRSGVSTPCPLAAGALIGGPGTVQRTVWWDETVTPRDREHHPGSRHRLGRGAHTTAYQLFIEAATALLDYRNVKRPKGNQNTVVKPWVRRWTNIIKQHIATIIAAHPGVQVAADLIAEHLVEKIGTGIGLTNLEQKNITAVMTGSDAGWGNIDRAA